MIISPPFLPASGLTSQDPTKPDPMMDVVDGYELSHHGLYPIAFDRRWHCGVHLVPGEQFEPVRAIADGDVVAYRVSNDAVADGQVIPDTGLPALNSNTGFVLLKHTTDTGEGRSLTFYSLYMHLMDIGSLARQRPQVSPPSDHSSPEELTAWLSTDSGGVQAGAGKKVYRKDILGFFGQNHGYPHLHFEIFMTEEDFKAWFEQDGHKVQLGEKQPVQPTSADYWGHTYFVIPGGQAFVEVPPLLHQSDSAYFPRKSSGTLDGKSTLYVEAWFSKGQRYSRSWLDADGSGQLALLTPEPVQDPYADYEYKLYQRAMDLYPACPSDGYELMRFGRILSGHPTLPETAAARATYVAVPFDANGTLGYVDVNQRAILKLSDADFPFFMGWQKIDGASQALDRAGLWDCQALRTLVGDAASSAYQAQQANPEIGLDEDPASYVQGSDPARAWLKGFVCHAPSEWDSANNDQRYQGLNQPDGFFGSRAETDPGGYTKFLSFLQKFQFLDQTPLGGGKKFWFFHPLAFIRHFRKCEWLASQEIAQCIPREFVTLHGANFAPHSNEWQTAKSRGVAWERDLNISMRKYQISSTKQRATHFLAQVMEESGWLGAVREYYGENQPYNPYFGRGLIQLTLPPNYVKYGNFKKFPVDNSTQAAQFHDIHWNPNVLLAQDNSVFNRENCADSAGLYWTCSKMTAIGVNTLKTSDNGISMTDIVIAAKSTNGNVANQIVNGLEHRVISFVFIKYVLMDLIESAGTEVATFVWRRNSAKEPVLDQNGAPVLNPHTHHPEKRYYPATYNLRVSLEKQRP